jgi:hypothetical protein
VSKKKKLQDALRILETLGMPKAQLNERSALCLLALVDIKPTAPWAACKDPLIGITPIMDWAKAHYGVDYAPTTKESFRRQSMHQFIEAAICRYNPDKPNRPVNSPKAVYQIEPTLLRVLQAFGTPQYEALIAAFLSTQQSLTARYAKEREMVTIPLVLKSGATVSLSPGDHSQLIRDIVEQFGRRYAPDGELVYVGDTGDKHGYFNDELFRDLGVELDAHGKMPDVVIYMRLKNWLVLVESVTSHGPVDSKRQIELNRLFKGCSAGLIFVSAFPNRRTFLKHLSVIAWESEVWIADTPTHLIHFNGTRFLGPY